MIIILSDECNVGTDDDEYEPVESSMSSTSEQQQQQQQEQQHTLEKSTSAVINERPSPALETSFSDALNHVPSTTPSIEKEKDASASSFSSTAINSDSETKS